MEVFASRGSGDKLIPVRCPHYTDVSCVSSSGDSICGYFHGSEPSVHGFEKVFCGQPKEPFIDSTPDPFAPEEI